MEIYTHTYFHNKLDARKICWLSYSGHCANSPRLQRWRRSYTTRINTCEAKFKNVVLVRHNAIIEKLDFCLLTDQEFKWGPKGWKKKINDPIFGWVPKQPDQAKSKNVKQGKGGGGGGGKGGKGNNRKKNKKGGRRQKKKK